MIYLFFLIFTFSGHALAYTPNICDIIDTGNCHGITKQSRRSSSLSLPSPATSANVNPATVSFDRGVGVEVLHQSHNAVGFNVASGTGKMGSALISSSLENSFFGNRVPEIDDLYFKRRENKNQFESKKLTLAVGRKLVRKSLYMLDVGLLLKRHSEIKRINPGIGAAARIGRINFGASYYQDDLFLNFYSYFRPGTGTRYSTLYASDTYMERFLVESYSVGTKIRNLTLDAGVIKTRYKFYLT
ncbi:MAG TPA: hypothetical protein VNJ08_17610 [Bacteriovoracaceae bacterium]|nr:hypothetical protein [Bacteriovoracaceae bacterium]